MKTSFLLLTISLLLSLFTALINPVCAQIPTVSGAQCVVCGGMNGNHKSTCKYFNPSSTSNPGSTGYSMEQEIMGTIFQSLVKSVFSSSKSNDVKSAEEIKKTEEEKQNRIKQLAIKQLILKRYNDSISNAQHEKMMKDYKKLDGSGGLTYKGLDDDKKFNASVKFNCKITSFKGEVKILKSNGQIVALSENQSVDLAVGDWIATGSNSSVKLHYLFESGGEDIMLGQKSALNIVTNEEGNHVPKLIRGNLYATNNVVTEKIAETQEEIIKEAETLKAQLRNKYFKQIRTPSAVTSIRGTEFTIYVDSLGTTEVIVKNGIVDLKGYLNENPITLTAGYKGMVNIAGEIKGPVKYEESEINNWWKE